MTCPLNGGVNILPYHTSRVSVERADRLPERGMESRAALGTGSRARNPKDHSLCARVS